jgi:hypothetical protein
MSDGIEDLDAGTPSLLEIRRLVWEHWRQWTATAGDPWELDTYTLSDVCETLYYLAGGDRGRLVYLTNVKPAADFAEEEQWLSNVATIVPQGVIWMRDTLTRWEALWRQSGAPDVYFYTFREALADMIFEGLCTGNRQHLLAGYGEST